MQRKPGPSTINHSPSAISEVPSIAHEVLDSLAQPFDSGTRDFPAPRLGHDFSSLRVSAGGEVLERVTTQERALLRFRSEGPTPAAPPVAPTPGIAPTVDQIDIVDGSTGAIGGFGAIDTGDLNVPGPFNNPTTGGVHNVHQIHFHLDQGFSALLTPARIVRASNWLTGVEIKTPADEVLPPGFAGPPIPGGLGGMTDAPDGPALHEINRPAKDKIVIADAPGIARLSPARYPYVHKSTFSLTVAGPGNTPVARIRYRVQISKKTATDIPNTENSISSIEKEDLVRGVSLP